MAHLGLLGDGIVVFYISSCCITCLGKQRVLGGAMKTFMKAAIHS